MLKGAGSYIFPFLRSSHVAGGALSADHCYGLFLRHYGHLRRHLPSPETPKVVAELGPGNSLGVGLAALLAGAQQYVALDIQQHTSFGANAAVFERLIALFQARAAPPSGPFPPAPIDEPFPEELTEALSQNLAPERLDRIRTDLLNRKGEFIRYVAPWSIEAASIQPSSVDWLLSHSVLEHIDDLQGAYASIASWLRPGGFTTHLIDFDSHRTTEEWNGHWAVPDLQWRLARGRRPYFINRAWRSRHMALMTEAGLIPLHEMISHRTDGLDAVQFAERFTHMPPEDARTRMSFIVAQKSPDERAS
jgi:hypothetical protein